MIGPHDSIGVAWHPIESHYYAELWHPWDSPWLEYFE